MTRAVLARAALVLVVGLGLGVVPGSAHAGALRGSRVALPLLASASPPELVLAQRTIDRSWGPSDDSTYTSINLPDWRSEQGALALSAIVPGAGQVYAGNRSGLLYTLTDAVAVFESWYGRRQGRDRRDDAFHYAGVPTDSSARFSFATYEERTGQSSASLRELYAADRDQFYYLVSRDDAYRAGWSDAAGAGAERGQFLVMRGDSESSFRRARMFQSLIWATHLVSAFDALRVARVHNQPIRENLELKLHSHLAPGHLGLTAALETRF